VNICIVVLLIEVLYLFRRYHYPKFEVPKTSTLVTILYFWHFVLLIKEVV